MCGGGESVGFGVPFSRNLEAVTVSGGENWRSCVFLPSISPCDPLSSTLSLAPESGPNRG